MGGIPAHGRGFGTKWCLRSLPAQPFLWFHDALNHTYPQDLSAHTFTLTHAHTCAHTRVHERARLPHGHPLPPPGSSMDSAHRPPTPGPGNALSSHNMHKPKSLPSPFSFKGNIWITWFKYWGNMPIWKTFLQLSTSRKALFPCCTSGQKSCHGQVFSATFLILCMHHGDMSHNTTEPPHTPAWAHIIASPLASKTSEAVA